jgi:hypothetical protein
MKTVKEKAKELVDKFGEYTVQESWQSKNYFAIECALIAVDEIDDIYQKLTPKDDPYYFLLELEYWQEVKQEIEKQN